MNPLNPAIRQTFSNLSELKWDAVSFIPSLITGIVMSIVLLVFIVLWPYGLITIVAGLLWNLIKDSRQKMSNLGLMEKMPYTMAIGIYFVVWLPFGVLCLPFVIIGFIGQILSGL